jgi:hypothetical protein
MLGPDYPGYFETGDAKHLASRLLQARNDRAYLKLLQAARARRRTLFTPLRESRAIRTLVASLLS